MHRQNPLVLHAERGRLLPEVRLVEDDELRALPEPGPVGGELTIDHAVTLVGVACRGVDHMEQDAGPLEVGEELVPEADSLARALDQARHVCDGELSARRPPVGRAVHRPEHRRQRREGVVGDLRLRIGDPAQERRLAGIRQPCARGVCHQLEMQFELTGFSREPGLRISRRLAGRGREVRVPAAAAAAARHHDPRTVLPQVGDEHAAVGIGHLRPHGNGENDVGPVGAVLAGSAPVSAPLCIEDRLGAKRRQVAQTGVGDDDDVSSAAAVTTVRPALRHELLAAEAEAAVAATPRTDANTCPIVEHAHPITSSPNPAAHAPGGAAASLRAR